MQGGGWGEAGADAMPGSPADGQTHIGDVRIGSHDLVRCTLHQLAKKSPQHYTGGYAKTAR